MSLNLGQQIGDDPYLPDKLLKGFCQMLPKLQPFASLGMLNFSARYLKKVFKLGAWNLVSW